MFAFLRIIEARGFTGFGDGRSKAFQISVISGTPSARTRARDPAESSGEGPPSGVGDEPKSRGKFYRIFRTCSDSQMHGPLGRERWKRERNERKTLRYVPTGQGRGVRKGRPKSLDFIAGLNGLQSNACTTRREITRPFRSHNFCRFLQIAIIYLK